MWTMKSKYNVGDIVTIKEKYDNNCTDEDYPCVFTHVMLDVFRGKKMEIKSVHKMIFNKKPKLYTEDYYYILKDDENKWWWTDSMFQECELWYISLVHQI